jgi:glucose-6-phosphate isomerase, archaeal
MKPFEEKINLENGFLGKEAKRTERKLNDLTSFFLDSKSVSEFLKKDNPLVYEVYESVVPNKEGHIIFGTSIIYPGKIGKEFFMTKGHYHLKPASAEVYFCFKGKGFLIMQDLKGETAVITMEPGSVGYVPPLWAHRTVNHGKEPFICFFSVPADAGHDYSKIEKNGFKINVLEVDGEAKVVSVDETRKILNY